MMEKQLNSSVHKLNLTKQKLQAKKIKDRKLKATKQLKDKIAK